MKQYNFEYHTVEEAVAGVDHIQALLATTPHGDAAAFVFVTNYDAGALDELLVLWDARLAEVKRVGISEGYQVGGVTESRIKFNLILSDREAFRAVQIPCRPGGEIAAAEKLKAEMDGLPAKGIALYPCNQRLNITRFLHAGPQEVPVFGAMAMRFTGQFENGYGIGKAIIDSGFTALIIYGECLSLTMDYILGWEPVGREMELTLEENDTVGETKIRLIDGSPAVEIYRKYLGVEWDDNFVANVCEFPLMVRRGDIGICYVPVDSKDGGLTLAGTIREDEKLRFSYGTREDILGASEKGSRRMARFAPDAVVMALCGNRVNFLGKDAHLEWDFYRRNNPELVYSHGYCEIAYKGGVGGVLTSAFVAVGMRECGGSASQAVESGEFITGPDRPAYHGQIPLSYRVSHFFHIMTDELVHLQHNLEDEVEKKTRENEGLSFHVVQTLAEAIDAKDAYTHGHSGRVARYSREIAKRAGMSEKAQNEIFMMGLLHDVGKIGVPDTVINKPGRLTDEEFAMIKTHPATGARILAKIKEMPNLAVGAHWHHERIDGRGYPDGLKGDEIPLEARIIAVADAYDAMTSNRSYREVMPQAKVREQIEKGLGTQFDPKFGSIMLNMIDEDAGYNLREKKREAD